MFDQASGAMTNPVGTANLVFHSCSSATLSYAINAGTNAGSNGTLDLTRIGAIPAGCHL